MDTIEYHLNQLPEPQRSQALKNAVPAILKSTCPNVSIAIGAAFDWIASPEGHSYWLSIANKAKLNVI